MCIKNLNSLNEFWLPQYESIIRSKRFLMLEMNTAYSSHFNLKLEGTIIREQTIKIEIETYTCIFSYWLRVSASLEFILGILAISETNLENNSEWYLRVFD